jgi:Zn finger protein HypA/HybF involved in hydrogenase expression
MRPHGIWAITCGSCGWAPAELRDTVAALDCPECGTRLEIEFGSPLEVAAVRQDLRAWMSISEKRVR